MIRPATTADLDTILAIQSASPAAAQWDRPWYRQALCSDEGRYRLAVAEHAGGIAAFAVTREVAGETELLNLAVSPGCRRRGIGRLLLQSVLGDVVAFLEVRASNQPAARLYESAGFRVEGRRPKYYLDPPDDALIMRRESP